MIDDWMQETEAVCLEASETIMDLADARCDLAKNALNGGINSSAIRKACDWKKAVLNV